MTDKTSVEGLGEATPFPFKVIADPNIEWKLKFTNERGAIEMDLPAIGIPDILVPRIFKSITSYDALTQRVKVLEEALGMVLPIITNRWRPLPPGSHEKKCMRKIREALPPPAGEKEKSR